LLLLWHYSIIAISYWLMLVLVTANPIAFIVTTIVRVTCWCCAVRSLLMVMLLLWVLGLYYLLPVVTTIVSIALWWCHNLATVITIIIIIIILSVIIIVSHSIIRIDLTSVLCIRLLRLLLCTVCTLWDHTPWPLIIIIITRHLMIVRAILIIAPARQ
jgi:hypothetical protein